MSTDQWGNMGSGVFDDIKRLLFDRLTDAFHYDAPAIHTVYPHKGGWLVYADAFTMQRLDSMTMQNVVNTLHDEDGVYVTLIPTVLPPDASLN